MRGEGGSRIEWSDIPEPVRASVESAIGARVESAVNQSGGFSPGLAARCTLEDGRRIFIKAVSPTQNTQAARTHRREIEIASALSSGAPRAIGARLLHHTDDGHWVCLMFEDIDGARPPYPWNFEDLDIVMESLAELPAAAPSDVLAGFQTFEDRHDMMFDGWRRLAGGDGDASSYGEHVVAAIDQLAEIEADWVAASAGDQLVHSDIRADNVLLTADGVRVVDWPYGCRGAPIVDRTLMLCDIGLGGGPDPGTVLDRYRFAAGIEDEFRSLFCAVVGFFVRRSGDAPPPGLPRLRAFQRAQADVGLPWLLSRLR